jgi:asparagine synthase (glutamine-hydrolysing)
MCGICGIYNFTKDQPVSKAVLHEMTGKLTHRGPDDSGFYLDRFIGLGHRRLSIIDLQKGHQPMSNKNNTVWVTYNGEIYNFKELKGDLEQKGHRFVTDCDTEVIIHSYEEYGPDCLVNFNGMFAFAVWARETQTLFMARDRLGIKPLYYTITGGNLIFASEIKAILTHPAVKAEVEVASIPEYLFCTTLLNDSTMFKRIHTLPPGHMLVFKNGREQLTRYWDIDLGNREAEGCSFERCKEEIVELLKDSVSLRLMSDVPFGSLLSGGLDSSLISAFAARHLRGQHHTLKTFSMEYGKNRQLNNSNSDTPYARMMAEALPTLHKDHCFEPEDYYDNMARVTWHMEKPVELTTPSLYLLYRSLKSDITVVLSGEGADELFGGYFFFLTQDPGLPLVEFPWAPYFKEVSQLLAPGIERETRFREKVSTTLAEMMNRFNTGDPLNKILYLFLKLYLLEMLERQDKTSMAWGMESRVPFLDHRLVEFVAAMPSEYKLRGEVEKFILKEIGRDWLLADIVNRKKKPFPFPIDPQSIIRQRNTANKLVQSGSSRIARYFDPQKTADFFHKRNRFAAIDNLAVFRTSFALIALELWHNVFEV